MLLGGQVYTVEYLPHPELRFVALSPDFPLSTHEARRVLPSMVSHSDAVRNAGFLAVLLRAIEQGDEELILPFCVSPVTRASPPGWSVPFSRWSITGRCGIFRWTTTAP